MTDRTFEWTDDDGDRLEVEPWGRAGVGWYVTTADGRGRATVVALPESEVERLIRTLRPDLLPARYTVRSSLPGNWLVYDGAEPDSGAALVVSFGGAHPDPEAAARAEADRLNGGVA